jgi:plastocyanin
MNRLCSLFSRDRRLAVAALTALCLVVPARAEQATISVLDDAGAPVADAVVSLTSPDPALNADPSTAQRAVMAQRNKQFVPHVLPVRAGTTVRFPNHDEFRHQIYSFSKPKVFEISLYGGDEEKRETFDKTGVVALGCNIHDTMLGYIYVLDTDHFAVTGDDGVARIDGLKPGEYTIAVWHPRRRGEAVDQHATITAGAPVTAQFRVSLKPPVVPAGAP